MSHKIDENSEKQMKYNLQTIANIEANTFEDRAFGSILGAFLADATGSKLEFWKTLPSDSELDYAMEMPGGGPH